MSFLMVAGYNKHAMLRRVSPRKLLPHQPVRGGKAVQLRREKWPGLVIHRVYPQ